MNEPPGPNRPQTEGSVTKTWTSDFDPVLLVVMSNAIQAICRQMTNTMLRAARSSVLATGRDFSCSIVTADNQLLDGAEALPIHAIGSEFLPKSMTELHDDIRPGDAYLHNDPYLGNTHHADHTILVPVFVDGKHLFTTCAKGHQADIGNAKPSTYMPAARDIYEEGALCFPCVRIQRDCQDVKDIIRMCQRRIRVPDIWYGDYLAALGAARIGERALQDFVRKYGLETVSRFLEEWFDYSERRMIQAIGEMPAGQIVAETRHDPYPGIPDGVPLKITITIDKANAKVVADLRDNPDCVPAGINMTESTARGAVLVAVLNSIESDVPHNTGSFRRIEILLRENCVAGIPRHPASCSLATTNLTDRIINMARAAFAEHSEGWGMAEGPTGIPPTHATIYGKDPRRAYSPYITQLLAGTGGGGPGSPVCDGWLSYCLSVTAGLLYRDSAEVLEQKYPIIVKETMVWPDSEGPGKWRGAPGCLIEYGPLYEEMEASFNVDGVLAPAKGVRGGMGPPPTTSYRRRRDGQLEVLTDPVIEINLQAGEFLGAKVSGGGGYGAPLERSEEAVLEDVQEGYVSVERAQEVYGVVIAGDPTKPETLTIDALGTARLRGSQASSSEAAN